MTTVDDAATIDEWGRSRRSVQTVQDLAAVMSLLAPGNALRWKACGPQDQDDLPIDELNRVTKVAKAIDDQNHLTIEVYNAGVNQYFVRCDLYPTPGVVTARSVESGFLPAVALDVLDDARFVVRHLEGEFLPAYVAPLPRIGIRKAILAADPTADVELIPADSEASVASALSEGDAVNVYVQINGVEFHLERVAGTRARCSVRVTSGGYCGAVFDECGISEKELSRFATTIPTAELGHTLCRIAEEISELVATRQAEAQARREEARRDYLEAQEVATAETSENLYE